MPKIGLIRCDKNLDKCPLTGCFTCLQEKKQGFAGYDETTLTGVMTCHCPGDDIVAKAKLLKTKGAEVIHLCTCLFCKREEGTTWTLGNGFCDHTDEMARRIADEAEITCIKGSAHLPKGYVPEVFTPRPTDL
jgi:predicted metal-binding protein